MLTVTTPATDLALLTVEELRRAINATDASADSELAAYGLQAAAVISRACNLAQGGSHQPTLKLETLSETQRLVRPADMLLLARRFIKDVLSVTVDEVALAASDYEVSPITGILSRLRNDRLAQWEAGRVVVTYRAGLETIPPDLRTAASILVRDLYHASRQNPALKSERVDGVGDFQYWVGTAADPAIPQEVMDLLRPYATESGF